jgi:hypothetical protein
MSRIEKCKILSIHMTIHTFFVKGRGQLAQQLRKHDGH